MNRRPTPPITADDATKFVLRILRDDFNTDTYLGSVDATGRHSAVTIGRALRFDSRGVAEATAAGAEGFRLTVDAIGVLVTVPMSGPGFLRDIEADARVFYEGDEDEPTVVWLAARDGSGELPEDAVRELWGCGWETDARELAREEGLVRL